MKWEKSEAAINKLCAQLQCYLTNDEIVAKAGAFVMRTHGSVLQTYSYEMQGDQVYIESLAWDGRTMTTAIDLKLARLSGDPVSYLTGEWWFLVGCTLGFRTDSSE
jgi:hypothetical protein